MCRAVDEPMAPGLYPCPARPLKLRVRPRRLQSRRWGTLNLAFRLTHCRQKGADRLRALAVFMVSYELFNLTGCFRRVLNQRRSVPGPSAVCRASSRTKASCRRLRTASPGTVRPAASCASLLANASSQPAGACVDTGISSMKTWYPTLDLYSSFLVLMSAQTVFINRGS